VADRGASASGPGAGDWIFAARAQADADGARAGGDRAPGASPLELGALRRLGQLHASYLLLEGPDGGLVLVDQHAAHERVLYERLRAGWLERGVDRQGLLLPLTLGLEERLRSALLEHDDAARRLGFEIEAFGEDAVIVRSVPALLGARDPGELVRELAQELAEERGSPLGADASRWLPAADRIFATLACHAARRFGDRLVDEEQRAILEGLDAVPWAPTCPHGRPVAVALDAAEIERRFSRR